MVQMMHWFGYAFLGKTRCCYEMGWKCIHHPFQRHWLCRDKTWLRRNPRYKYVVLLSGIALWMLLPHFEDIEAALLLASTGPSDFKGSSKILLDICNCSKVIGQKWCHATHKKFRPVYSAFVLFLPLLRVIYQLAILHACCKLVNKYISS